MPGIDIVSTLLYIIRFYDTVSLGEGIAVWGLLSFWLAVYMIIRAIRSVKK